MVDANGGGGITLFFVVDPLAFGLFLLTFFFLCFTAVTVELDDADDMADTVRLNEVVA